MTATLERISPAALAEIRRLRPVRLVDVRTPAEFESVHAEGAENVPLDRLDPAAVRAGADEVIYLICQSGARGQKACEKLLAGNPPVRVVNVEGGTGAWEAAGLPVVRGRKRMSLERQVRIAAGSLVVIGVVLGLFVHPWLAGFAGIVGAGLVFAGLTDTCGMGMLLARMPWNRGQASCRS